jgi:hypothetical protein
MTAKAAEPTHVHYCAEPTPCRGTLPVPRAALDGRYERLRAERAELVQVLRRATVLVCGSGQFRAGEAAWLQAGSAARVLLGRLDGGADGDAG